MVNLQSAIAAAAAGQYLTIAINVAAMLILARVLAPADFGIALLGAAILSLAEAVREVAGSAYLIREADLTLDKKRTTTTMSALITVGVVLFVLVAAEPLAQFFSMPSLTAYLGVAVLGYALGPMIHPPMALLTREFAFARLGIINFVNALVGSSAAIILAVLGFGAQSLAWAGVASAASAAILCLVAAPDVSIYRPSLSCWRGVLGFGAYSGVTAILGKLNEALPVYIVGRLLTAEALAIGQRAAVVSLLPERIVLAAVGPVALAEISRRARAGADLQAAYLSALSYMSVVQWPAAIMLAILAEPVVLLALGPQWVDTIPLVRILCPALMLSVPIGLQYAVLVAASAVDRLPLLLVLQLIVMAVALMISAPFGLVAAACSMYLAMPILAILSLLTVHRVIGLRWQMLGGAAARSAFVTLTCAIAPLGIALSMSPLPMTIFSTASAVVLGAVGWGLGLHVSRHPLRNDLVRIGAKVLELPAFQRLFGNR